MTSPSMDVNRSPHRPDCRLQLRDSTPKFWIWSVHFWRVDAASSSYTTRDYWQLLSTWHTWVKLVPSAPWIIRNDTVRCPRRFALLTSEIAQDDPNTTTCWNLPDEDGRQRGQRQHSDERENLDSDRYAPSRKSCSSATSVWSGEWEPLS